MKILCASQMGAATIMGQTMRVIAIAKALQRRGHQVLYLAGEQLASVVTQHGLPLVPLPPLPPLEFPPDADRLAKDPAYRQTIAAALKENLSIILQAEKETIRRENPDWIVSGSLLTPLAAARAVAARPVPCALSFLQPHGQKTLQHFQRGMSSPALAQERQAYLAEIMAVVAREFPGVTGPQEILTQWLAAVPLIFIEGMPEISGDADLETLGVWGDRLKDKLCFTGPLLPDDPQDLPSRETLKLIHAGRKDQPLVYVTIGGGSGLIGAEFLKLVLEMFRRLPETRGVIATGLAIPPAELLAQHPPENVAIRGFVPGMELIKASDVTVFHGGSSTLMSCIACGRPAIAIPSMGEQEDNGAVLARHGAGLVLDKQTLTAAGLTAATQQILTDRSFERNAQNLQELGRKYGGAASAGVTLEIFQERRMAGAGSRFSSR